MAYSDDLNNCLLIDGLKSENQQLLDRVSKLEIALEQANKDITTLQAREVSSQEGPKEAIVKFNCNACLAHVSFISGKETSADKKHLCHTCFVKTGAWMACVLCGAE